MTEKNIMKITKKQLRKIIKETVLAERAVGLIPGFGFLPVGKDFQNQTVRSETQTPAALAMRRRLKITKRQLRKMITEEMDLVAATKSFKIIPQLVGEEEEDVETIDGLQDPESVEESIRLSVRKVLQEIFPGQAPAGNAQRPADSEWEWGNMSLKDSDEKIMEPKSFKLPYRDYGYKGRRIISRDRAWLEFVPKGSDSLTRSDMFRAVTKLDHDDPEISKALMLGTPKSMAPLDAYDIYYVYATTTG